MRRGATFDATGNYRYWLWRTWDTSRHRVAFVMLNPSTADHRVDDPTIRRCIGFAHSWGYGSLVVVNLFAYRTPSPAQLARAADPVGSDNDGYLLKARRRCRDVVLAWGTHGRLHDRDIHAVNLLAHRRKRALLCLGRTQHGCPRHPLYLPASTLPVPYLPGHSD